MKRKLSRSIFVCGALGASLLVSTPSADGVTSTSNLTTQTATDVANSLVGPGVSISNVTFEGADIQAGSYVDSAGAVGFDGVVLSSGAIADTVGPNISNGTTTAISGPGDADLDALSGFETFDAAVLEFDFTADADTIFFQYVFASEEYNEFVNTQFNDTFGFFVNGTNCAVIDDGTGLAPISVNTINDGNPTGDTTATNPTLYRNNDLQDGGGLIDTEMDGLTIVLTCVAPVAAGVNHMKLAIADASDLILDSVVFLEEGSLSTTPPGDIGRVTGGGRMILEDGAANFGLVVTDGEQGLQGNLQINVHRTHDKFHGFAVDSLSVVGNTATWTGTGRWNGDDGYRFEIVVVDNRNGNSKKKGDPDSLEITIVDSANAVVWSTAGPVDLTKGNIKLH